MNKRSQSSLVGKAALVVMVGSGVAGAQEHDPAMPLEAVVLEPYEMPERDPADPGPELRPDRATPSGVGMSRDAFRQVPGALDDPTRAIEIFPGQSWLVSGLPHVFVRGEPPDNTGYHLDGIRLPLVHHFGAGPGVVAPSLIDRVDFYPGAAPAHFGRAAGGAVVLEPSPDPIRARSQASMRLFDAGVTTESPFSQGRGRAQIGARYAYSAALASLISSDYAGWYGDYHARASYDLSSADRIGLFALGAYDDLAQKTQSGTEPVITTQFHRLDLRYDRRLGADARVRAAIQLGYDRAGGIDERYVTDRSKAFRLEVAQRLTEGLTLWWGGDVQLDSYVTENSETSDENYGAFLVDRDDRTMGVYVSANYRPSDGFEANWGIRADAYHSLGEDVLGVDPRASFRVAVTPRVRVIAAGGVAHQSPSVLLPVPAVRVAGLAGGLQKTVQTSAGWEVDLTPEISSSLVGFRHWHRSTSDFLGTLTTPDHIPQVLSRTDGTTTGGELTLRGRLGPRVGGYLAYTLSRSTRVFEGRSFVASFDRTHVGTAFATVDAGNRWRLGGRLTVVSGVPRHDPASVGGPHETDRAPVFFRVDGRAEKQWLLQGRFPLTAYGEVLNLSANREWLLSDCEESGCLKTSAFGPIIVPNVGAEIGF